MFPIHPYVINVMLGIPFGVLMVNNHPVYDVKVRNVFTTVYDIECSLSGYVGMATFVRTLSQGLHLIAARHLLLVYEKSFANSWKDIIRTLLGEVWKLDQWPNKQRVLMHRHQGLNVRHGLCHIYMRYLYIYELFIAFVCFVVCSLL